MGNPVTTTLTGNLPVVVADQSNPLGDGWGISGIDHLITGSTVGVVWATGSGDARVFTGNPGTLPYTFTSPSNDFGTLVENVGGTFTYTAKNQIKINFDSSGRQTSVVDTHSLATSYTYDTGGKLTAVATPDGGSVTMGYDGNNHLNAINESGGRSLSITVTAGGDLTGITDVDSTTRTLGYTSHRLTSDQWTPFNATITFDSTNNRLSVLNQGGGTSYTLIPEQTQA